MPSFEEIQTEASLDRPLLQMAGSMTWPGGGRTSGAKLGESSGMILLLLVANNGGQTV